MSYTQNYMVVDGVLKDLVEDIAGYFDSVSNVAADDAASFSTFVQERLAEDATSAQQEEIFKAIAEKSSVISSGPERDFEAQYNLVLHILTFSSDLTTLLPIVLKNLATPPSYNNGPLLTLAILTNLFNILPVSSPLRYQVFLAIFESAANSNNLNLVISQIKHLPTWLQQWNADEETTKEAYIKISSFLTASDNSDAVYQYLLLAVSAGATPLASQLALVAIGSESIYDFDEVFALKAIQDLKTADAPLFTLLETVANGDYPAYKKLDTAIATKHNLDADKLAHKVRVLSLARATSQATTRTISYALLADAIEVPADQVEVWIIDAIRAGLVEGRLSQINQSFAIHRATPVGSFGPEEWKLVASKLAGWKSGLKDIGDALKTARENAEKEEKAAKNKAAAAAAAAANANGSQPALVASK